MRLPVCALLFLGSTSAQQREEEADLLGMTYRENSVELKCDDSTYTMMNLEFVVREHKVSDGQDPDGGITDGSSRSFKGKSGAMVFLCGRQGSSEVAQWFTHHVPGSSTTFNHDPVNLNFALIGDLKIEFEGEKRKEEGRKASGEGRRGDTS